MAEALFFLTRELHALHHSISNLANNAILNRIAEMEQKIMSKISDFIAEQKAFNKELGSDVDKLAASAEAQSAATDGIAKDIDALNTKILELQNSPGEFTPADQILVDELQAETAATATRVKAAAAAAEAHAAALKALDEKTPPVVPAA